MRIEILEEAQANLIEGFHFYEGRERGLGSYFLDCLFSDIDSRLLYGGIHQVVYGYHRCLSGCSTIERAPMTLDPIATRLIPVEGFAD